MPRIVPLVLNRRVCEVSNNADVSQRKVIQIVRGVLGNDLLELQNASFLAVKFEKLVVSKNTSIHTSGNFQENIHLTFYFSHLLCRNQ